MSVGLIGSAVVGATGLLLLKYVVLKRYMNGPLCRSLERIDGKVVIVTGANTGIGKETAKELARRGGKVYLACRSVERARKAADEIVRSSGVPEDKLVILQLDLGSLQSVRHFVTEFKQRESKLDILINNAGISVVQRSTTCDGFETNLAVNHLGPFLLTHLLISHLLAAENHSRIINVASEAHRRRTTIDFDDLMMEKNYHGYRSYCRSKLANILFTRELSRRLGSEVSVYCLHPGVVQTDLLSTLQQMLPLGRFLMLPAWYFFKDPWHGAQTTIYCAVDSKIASDTGKYYSDCAEKQPAQQALDADVAQRLWDISVQLVRLDNSEIHPLLR